MAATFESCIFFVATLTIISGDFNVVILHTNDIHSRVEQTNKYSSSCTQSDAAANKCYGGVARRATAVEEIRSNYSNTVLLDAGDEFQGTLWFNVYKGWEASYFMNILKYDAMALGNHEFDNGVAGLVTPFLENVTFPVLACNVDASRAPELQSLIRPYVILDVAGQKIGVVGYITKETEFLTSPDGITSIDFLDVETSVRQYVSQLQNEGVNKIIGLGHSGFGPSKELAKNVEGLDVVIDGHSNTFLYTGTPPSIEVPLDEYPVVIDQTGGGKALVYQAYAYGKYLGMVDVTFNDDGDVITWKGNPILLDGSWEQDPDVLADVEVFGKQVSDYGETEVATSYVLLEGGSPTCRVRECNLGNFMTDAILYQHLRGPINSSWADVAIAITNGGGIRTSIPSGTVKVLNVMEAFPFNNEVVKLWITGQTLREMLEYSVTGWSPDEPSGRFLQVSGIRVTYDLDKAEGSRVSRVLVKCADCDVPRFERLKDEKVYGVITIAFLAKGGDGYSMLVDNIIEEEYFGTLVAESVMEYMKKVTPVTQGEEGRLLFRAGRCPRGKRCRTQDG